MTHIQSCQDKQEAYQKARQEFEQKWPKFCRFCYAQGGHGGQENVGERNYPIYQPYWDPCPACYERGVCPRCGSESFIEEMFVEDDSPKCPNCGWNERGAATKEGFALGDPPECLCEMQEDV